eukprot:TRINITY_DN40287_c0_g1_i1.p1 TRINITY_DN40287_c0_g1~~TRINITY_DN40287_c0_g1_i1.p1  ORF type:complete len:319 (+),score=13.76 TRINITY_DN40287_c0_g1_i1:88-957(+)
MSSPAHRCSCCGTAVTSAFTLHAYDAAPEHLKMRFIHSGYRVGFSLPLCFRSIFWAHNQTGNIWSHLLGFLLFVFIMYDTQVNVLKEGNIRHRIVFALFHLSVQLCFLASSAFHTFNSHSRAAYYYLNRLDCSGAGIILEGGYTISIAYGFHDHPSWMAFHLIGLHFVFLCVIIISLSPYFRNPRHNVQRVALFSIIFFYLFVFALHHWQIFGMESQEWAYFRPMMDGTPVLAIGALIYASRVPERFAPGFFDVLGCSHQLWHLSIVLSALIHHTRSVHYCQWLGACYE